MAKADCGFCEALGHRSCDYCGGPTFEPQNRYTNALGVEWCHYCEKEKNG